MRVLLFHNRYRQLGGEDTVALSETAMLQAHGIEVIRADFDNHCGDIALGLRSAWSAESYDHVIELCRRYRPDIAHVHNFWMKLTPSVHAACHAAGVPTVQTLHNYRLFCVNALFMRQGKICQDCLGRSPWRGVVRGCYRDSPILSTAVARMIVTNRRRGTWENEVDGFIALTQFSRRKFIEGNLPPEKIFVKPNFVEDPGRPAIPPSASKTVLYAGRLSEEKGLTTLLSAWAQAKLSRWGKLLIAGDGPQRKALEQQAASLGLTPEAVTFAGQKSPGETVALFGKARLFVLPSLFFEGFPRALVEAFSHGRAAVVSEIGSLAEIVSQNLTGIKFHPGDHVALGSALEAILTDDELADRLGQSARAEYLDKFTPERNFDILMRIYRFAIESAGSARREAFHHHGTLVSR